MSVLTRHWELKLLALAFSAVLWFFVTNSEKSDLIVAAPVELDGLPTGLEVVGDKPASIDVQLHGLRRALARLGPDQVKARLSLAGAHPGEVQIRIQPEHVQVPVGITVLWVNPSRIRLTLAAPHT
ncbi:MAG TPA: hypothetical protein VGR44_10760 [Methylomirabilota bacterium]|jgi:hypothetical protein|nr:hypothetical protein [Methylomirabilota bacterium]